MVGSAAQPQLAVTCQTISSLRPYPKNARTHSKHQILQIAASMREFGFTNPVLVAADGTIIAGHGRVRAAQLLGMTEVPTIRLDHLTQEQIRAYILADNKLAENAGWDQSILAIELQHLLTIESFDIRVTGFEVPEIDVVIGRAGGTADEADPAPPPAGPAVTTPGDCWQLGRHRILCGSALEPGAFAALLGIQRAALVFTDPPYNVAIAGNVCGKGAVQHREFQMAAGEMNASEFTAFLTTSLRLLAQFSRPGALHFVCMDWRHMPELLAAGHAVYDALLNLCVWVKDNGGMGSFYRSRHELVFVFRNGKAAHRNNVQLGRFGRNRTNVWEYPGINTLSRKGEEGNLLALHPTVKPVQLVADAILDCSAPGDIVLDAFLGSGSSLLAAERTGRRCYGMEIDPLYLDVAIRRWQRQTGAEAINSQPGKSFEEVATSKERAK